MPAVASQFAVVLGDGARTRTAGPSTMSILLTARITWRMPSNDDVAVPAVCVIKALAGIDSTTAGRRGRAGWPCCGCTARGRAVGDDELRRSVLK